MLLYHGSNVEVRTPKLLSPRRLLDFGAGFYMTSDLEQAKHWAERTTKFRESGFPLVSVFDFSDEALNTLKMLAFPVANQEWLRYVVAKRTARSLHLDSDYDLVMGPVANDQTYQTINLFLRGYITEEITLQLLLPQKLKNQYAFKTENALSCLRYSRAERYEKNHS